MNAPLAIALTGSPRGSSSTSAALNDFILRELARKGWGTQNFQIHQALKNETILNDLFAALSQAALVILAFPLYFDTLPAAVIRFMEQLADRQTAASEPARPWLLAVINCGFPENAHNANAAAICRHFAAESGWRWAGALSIGQGGYLDGRPIRRCGLTRRLAVALSAAVAELAAGQPVSAATTALFARLLMPNWLYLRAACWQWRRQAARNGTGRILKQTPYPNP